MLKQMQEIDGLIAWPFDLDEIKTHFKNDSPLHVVLHQECERYNVLLE